MKSTNNLTSTWKYFYFISISHLIISTSSLCLDHERSALWQFKSSLSINMSVSTEPFARPKVSFWKLGGNSTSDCCSWDGIECNQKTGSVIGLDLGSSFLYGSINSTSALFSLVNLQRFNLADNHFNYSQIPSAISRLSRLLSLNLSTSVFSGQIPSQIFGLVRLVSLDLSWNLDPLSSEALLTLDQKPGLSGLARNLTKLKELWFGNVFINSMVPDVLANMTSLTALSFHDCGLYGEFPSDIFLLPSLQIIWLYNNENLNGSLPEFYQTSSITELHVSGTSFYGPIPDSIGNLTELSYLSFSFTYIDVGRLASLGKLTKLNSLLLDGINLQGELPSSFANLTQLNDLRLSTNEVVGPIPLWLMKFTRLASLDLSRNQFQGPIPVSFSEPRNLEILSLNANYLSGTVEANVFFSLKKLRQLLLSGNHISFLTNNITYPSVPKFALLGLGSCNLSEFPEFLRFQDELQVLSLTQNMITEIPKWMQSTSKEPLAYPVLPWPSLRIFDLTYNMILGPIPIPPQNISFYYVSNNLFSGEIPPAICNLSSLSIFDLSNNNMSGTIPPCLGNLSRSLTVLNFKGNNFRGTMPHSYTEECGLRMINLSQNQLEGQIPSSLANCTMLEILDLGSNHLNDNIPFWLGALLELQVLVLSSNKLYGEIRGPTIPSTQFAMLRILDLSNNVLTGSLPVEYFQQLNAMKIPLADPLAYISSLALIGVLGINWRGIYEYSMTITNKGVKMDYVKILDVLIAIDLSNNEFNGEIQESIGSLKGIQSLNLSNNQLSGQIPSSIVNLTMIESLDLSRNELSGEIPEDLVQLSFLAFLNVSFNNLVRSIPKGKQFNTFMNNSYEGNEALCGEPLSLVCRNSKAPLPSIPEESNDYEFLNRTDWIVVLTALGAGLVVGLTFGQALSTWNHEWFVYKFGKWPKSWQSIQMLQGRGRRSLNMQA